MAATFNPTLATPLDQARQRLGDTDTNDPLFPDETYTAMLGAGASAQVPVRVAARMASDLSARYARLVTTDIDDQGKKWSDLTKQYAALAERLSAEAVVEERAQCVADAGDIILDMGGGVLIGGTSVAEVMKVRADPDHPDNAPWIS